MSSVKKSVNVRIDEETEKRLNEIAEKENKGMATVIREIIEGTLKPESTNIYQFLDDGCKFREYVEEEESPLGKKYGEGFYCFKKAPVLTKLGSGIESMASKICTKCNLRDEDLENSRLWKEQREKGITIQMPRCTKGGYVNEDAEEMYCPEIGKYRPIYDRKNKTDYVPCKIRGPSNSNCMYLKYTVVVKGLKEKDHR